MLRSQKKCAVIRGVQLCGVTLKYCCNATNTSGIYFCERLIYTISISTPLHAWRLPPALSTFKISSVWPNVKFVHFLGAPGRGIADHTVSIQMHVVHTASSPFIHSIVHRWQRPMFEPETVSFHRYVVDVQLCGDKIVQKVAFGSQEMCAVMRKWVCSYPGVQLCGVMHSAKHRQKKLGASLGCAVTRSVQLRGVCSYPESTVPLGLCLSSTGMRLAFTRQCICIIDSRIEDTPRWNVDCG